MFKKIEATEKYKFNIDIKYLRHSLSVFKTEERRRLCACFMVCYIIIISFPPTGVQYSSLPEAYALLSTPEITESLMSYTRAPHDKSSIYGKNLAQLVIKCIHSVSDVIKDICRL